LQAAVAAEWEGFLMVNLATASAPVESEWSVLQERLRPWRVADLDLGHRSVYEVAANWKLLFENFNECYHCARIHPLLSQMTDHRSASNDLDEGPLLGGPMELNDGAFSLTTDGTCCGNALLAESDPRRKQVFFYSVFPAMLFSLHPDYVLVHRLEPLSVDCTRVTCDFLFDNTQTDGELPDWQTAVEFWDRTNREDWHVCELAQQGVRSRAYSAGPLSQLESITAAWDRHYLTVMQER
jgi:Rieske 2Fe-2S family protein